MSFLGANTEQLREHAQRCSSGANAIGDLISHLHQVTSSVSWEGADAESFRLSAFGSFDRAIQVVDRITASSSELEQHAEEQDAASGLGDGSSVGDNAVTSPADGAQESGKTVKDDGNAEGTEKLEEDIPVEGDSTQLENNGQGGIADCYLLSSLGAIAQQDPEFFEEHVEEIEPGVYRVTMYDADGNEVHYIVESTPTNGARQDTDAGEHSIYSVYERAYQMHLDEVGGEDTELGWGLASDAMQTITGQKANYYPASSTPPIEHMEAMIDNGRPITASTGGIDEPSHPDIAGQHVYKVSSVDTNAGTVTVVNPWSGNETITMSYEEYTSTFAGTDIGRTREPSVGDRVDEFFDGTGGY